MLKVEDCDSLDYLKEASFFLELTNVLYEITALCNFSSFLVVLYICLNTAIGSVTTEKVRKCNEGVHIIL